MSSNDSLPSSDKAKNMDVLALVDRKSSKLFHTKVLSLNSQGMSMSSNFVTSRTINITTHLDNSK